MSFIIIIIIIIIILRIRGCLECCMLFRFIVFIVLYCTVLYCTGLYCPVLQCSTLPPAINPFAVYNNNNNNNNNNARWEIMGIQNLRFFKRKNIVTPVRCFGLQRSVVCRWLPGNMPLSSA